MHPNVKDAIESLHPKFEQLMASCPLTERRTMPQQGVYLFSESNSHLYVGRSNSIPRRYAGHRNNAANHNSAAFAMLLARKETGAAATYRPGAGRETLMQDKQFREAFENAKRRISKMQFRAVEETDQTRQALLEIYAAMALTTPFNDFGTH